MSHPCNSQVKFQLLNVFIREKKSRLDKVASQKTEVGFNSPISCLSLVPMSQIQIPQCVSQSPHVGVVPKLLSVRVRKKNHVKILSRVLYQVLGRFQVPEILPGSPVVPTSESEQSQDTWMDWVLVITAVIRREFSSSNGNWSHQGSRPSSHEPQSLLRSSQSSCHVWGSSIKSKNETPDCLKLFTREHV